LIGFPTTEAMRGLSRMNFVTNLFLSSCISPFIRRIRVAISQQRALHRFVVPLRRARSVDLARSEARTEPLRQIEYAKRAAEGTYEIGTSRKAVLAELSANSSGDGQSRMSVSKESSGVLLDLADVEIVSSVLSVGQQASLGRTLLAANTAADTIADFDGVRESDSRGTGNTLGSLVNVCGDCGGRLVLAMEVVELNVVADEVQLAVDPNLEETRGTGEITSGSCSVDDLVGGGLDFVVRGEFGGTGNCLAAFGGCCGAALGVVDGSSAARRGVALMEIFSRVLSSSGKINASRGSVEVYTSTKEPDLLTRRPHVKREVDLANALACDVLNNGYTVELASSDVVVDGVASSSFPSNSTGLNLER
ncbi:hypothetical protein KCU89_g145, partial [Aureobasidium melanogenum]